jgi:hypothetical protein
MLIMAKKDKKIISSKDSSEEDWKRLEKWHFGRANYP